MKYFNLRYYRYQQGRDKTCSALFTLKGNTVPFAEILVSIHASPRRAAAAACTAPPPTAQHAAQGRGGAGAGDVGGNE